MDDCCFFFLNLISDPAWPYTLCFNSGNYINQLHFSTLDISKSVSIYFVSAVLPYIQAGIDKSEIWHAGAGLVG